MNAHPWFFVTAEQFAAIPVYIPEVASKTPPPPYKMAVRSGEYMLGFGMRDEPVRLAVIAKTAEERVAQMVEAERPCTSCWERPPISETVAEAKRPDGTISPAVFYLCAECGDQSNKTHLQNGAAHARHAPKPKPIRPRQSNAHQAKGPSARKGSKKRTPLAPVATTLYYRSETNHADNQGERAQWQTT